MNIAGIMSQVTPEQLQKLEQNLNKVVPFIESKLPLLTDLENAWRKEYFLKNTDIFAYTAMKTPNNKILIYVNVISQIPENVKLSDGTELKKGTPIIKSQIKSFDLMEFLKNVTANGLTGLIENLF